MPPLEFIKRMILPSLAAAGISLVAADRGNAAQHLWEISQIYSNADGTVQYIELFNPSNNEHIVGGFDVFTYRDGGDDEQTFRFPSNLPSSSTANRYMLLATGPIEGVEPDYTIPENFVPIEFEETGTFDMEDMAWMSPYNVLTYDSIPTDGFRSLDRDGDIREPATVTNFAGDTAELSPPADPGVPEVFGVQFRDGVFGMAFTTESGHTYTVEFTDSLETDDWETLETIEGNGEPAEITDAEPGVRLRFYRVRVE